MRILVIRGANLASLEGEYELGLDTGPLAETGVFAICGPTGSGKSTLLDGVCLALFETAPRLEGNRRVRVRRDGNDADPITTSDPRSILRKGAGSGFAEVDFEGVDGRRYRARWDVRRARNRPEGKLQAATMSLTALDTDERWEGRKTDVKEEIERRLGLRFDQFKRSVLLAQGDFAAFLDAEPKDRADLLERMTGTAIYGAISIEAHARAVRERDQMDRAFSLLQAVPVLALDERAAQEGRVEELATQVRRDELAVHDAEAAVRWHQMLDALTREEREVVAREARIAEQLEAWEPRRRELEAAESVRPLRGLFCVVGGAAEAHEARSVELASARATARAAEEAAVAASVARRRAEDESAFERSRHEAHVGLVARARALDREIAALASTASNAAAQAQVAGARLARAVARHDEIESRAARLERDADTLQRWLEGQSASVMLAADWSRGRERLERLAQAHADEGAAALAWQRAKVRLSAAAVREAQAQARLTSLERAGRELEEVSQGLRAAIASASSGALDGPTEAWTARRGALETLVALASQAQEAWDAERRHRVRAERGRAAAANAEEHAQECARECALGAARMEELERQRDRVRAQLDLSAHRAELVDGEPCPLCGSEDHPLAAEAPALDAILSEVDQRLGALRDELRRAESSGAASRKEAEGQRAVANDADEEALVFSRKLALATARYRDAAGAIGGDASLTAELGCARAEHGELLPTAARALLDGALGEADEKLAELRRERDVRRGREREADALLARLEGVRRDASSARTAREDATRELGAAVNQEALARVEHARLEQERAKLEASLEASVAPVFAQLGASISMVRSADATLVVDGGAGGSAHSAFHIDSAESWRVAAARDPAAFVGRVVEVVEARIERFEALDGLRAQLRELTHERASSSAERRVAVDAHASAAEAHANANDEEAGARARRASVLEEDADPSEQRSSARLADAVQEAERRRAAQEAATLSEAKSRETRERASDAVDKARTALADASAALDRALADVALADGACADRALTRETALSLLALDPAPIDGWRASLERLDRERAEVEAVRVERARKREAHEASDAPTTDPAQSQTLVADAAARLAATRELLHGIRARIEQDDQNRTKSDGLMVELDAMRARLGVWEVLADLIGSASGAKLRIFAQSLTLDLLVEHANHHLRELVRRYALSRVPGESLALQVIDHEMGDEVRSVGSLSGGESFLVALGMALGLASLSSQRARVDTLFIDEGFGALDAASLEQVLGTLDELRAKGRQIGLISHVPTVAERFETRVEIVPAGPARSRVEVVGRDL